MSAADAIKYIIDQHNKHQSNFSENAKPHSENSHQYWKNKLANNDDVRGVFAIIEQNKNNHHIGDYYRKEGMNINPYSDHPQAKVLKEVLNYIKDKLSEDSDDDQLATSSDSSGSEDGKEKFVEAGKKDKKQDLARSLNSVDLLEEVEIKVLAVSILSETNGNCDFAKQLLNSGGIKAIKSMNVKELKGLAGELKTLSEELSMSIKKC